MPVKRVEPPAPPKTCRMRLVFQPLNPKSQLHTVLLSVLIQAAPMWSAGHSVMQAPDSGIQNHLLNVTLSKTTRLSFNRDIITLVFVLFSQSNI